MIIGNAGDGDAVTDQVLAFVAENCRSLKTLGLSGQTNVSRKAFEALKKQRPELKIDIREKSLTGDCVIQ